MSTLRRAAAAAAVLTFALHGTAVAGTVGNPSSGTSPVTATQRSGLERLAEGLSLKAHNAQRTARDPQTRNGDRHTDVGGGAPLTPWTDIQTVARRWSDRLTFDEFFHNPDYSKQYGYRNAYGENIAIATMGRASDKLTSDIVARTTEQLMQGWWNSTGHRRNWMRPGWKHFAVGASIKTEPFCFDPANCEDYWTLALTTNFRTPNGAQIPDTWCGFPADGSLTPNEGDRCGATSPGGGTSGPKPKTTFADVPLDHRFHGNIEALAKSGITKGCGTDRFCPDRRLTRGEMAAFFDRALDLPSGNTSFSDTRGHLFEANIAALADAGITRGCGTDKFCPDRKLTRAEMAAFIDRAGIDRASK